MVSRHILIQDFNKDVTFEKNGRRNLVCQVGVLVGDIEAGVDAGNKLYNFN